MKTAKLNLTKNEEAFLEAARSMMCQEDRTDFCWVDLNNYGYDRQYSTRHATLGSLVKKGVVSEPVDGWSSILVEY